MTTTQIAMGKVCKVLLDGGVIAEHCTSKRTSPVYTLLDQKAEHCIGQITEEQFLELVSAGVIESELENRAEKLAHLFTFYRSRNKAKNSNA